MDAVSIVTRQFGRLLAIIDTEQIFSLAAFDDVAHHICPLAITVNGNHGVPVDIPVTVSHRYGFVSRQEREHRVAHLYDTHLTCFADYRKEISILALLFVADEEIIAVGESVIADGLQTVEQGHMERRTLQTVNDTILDILAVVIVETTHHHHITIRGL